MSGVLTLAGNRADFARIPWSRNELVVAVDTETSGLFVDDGARVSVVSLAWHEDDELVAVAIPFDQGMLESKQVEGTQISLLSDDAVNLDAGDYHALMRWLEEQYIIMHNAKFDLHILKAGHRIWGGGVDLCDRVIWDTQLAQVILEPLELSGLKPTSARLWGVTEKELAGELAQYQKNNKLDRGRFDLVPWDIVGPYAAKDAELTMRLYEYQAELLKAEDNERLPAIMHEIGLMRVLFKMEQRGVGFNADCCIENAMKLQDEIEAIKAKVPFPTTPAGIKAFYYGKKDDGGLGLLPHAVTPKKGLPVLDIEVLRKLVEADAPYAADIQRLHSLESAVSKWYGNWPYLCGADGRLRASYRQAKVVSGRISVERVQLQAIPHDYRLPDGVDPIRSMFTAPKGKVLYELDLGQAEVRVATAMAHCRAMLEDVLEVGGDVHGATATTLFGVTPESDNWKEMRLIAKRCNFGMLYGAGADTIRDLIMAETGKHISDSDMSRIIQRYHATFPEFRSFMAKASRVADKRGYIKLITGRRRYFAPHEVTHKAFNQVIQGGVACIMGMWMIEVEKRWPGVLLLQIHDSLVLELDKKTAKRTTKAIAKCGIDLMEAIYKVPFVIDIKEWH